jgi:hypothetical protein
MARRIFFFFATGALLVLLNTSNNQSYAALPNSVDQAFVSNAELLIQFPSLDEKNYDHVRNTLAVIPGVTVNAYCATNKIFALLIDRNILPSDEPIFATLKANDCGEYFVKESATAADLYSNCSDIR